MSDIWLTHHDWCTRQAWPANGLSFFGAGRQRRDPRVVILHSTETTSWPGYGGGAANPHLTIDLRNGHTRQHVPLNWGARALMVGPVRTNNIDGVIQVEIIGAVTPGYPRRYGHYDLVNTFPTDDDAHRYLARLLRAISDACAGVPIHISDHGRWVPYPASYGVNASQRLSVANFQAARGWLGHQHVPGNSHGDPGALVGLASAVLTYALGATSAPPATRPGADDPFADFDREFVRSVQARLNALGITDADGNALVEDGIYGERTKQAIRTYQQLRDLDVDDIAGPNTDKSLEDDMKMLTDIHRWVGNQGQKLDTVIREVRKLATVELGPNSMAELATGRQVWGTTRFLGLVGHRAATAANRATVARDTAIETKADVVGLKAAMGELAKGSGVDPALIERVVHDATARALSDLRIVSSRDDEEDRAAVAELEAEDAAAAAEEVQA